MATANGAPTAPCTPANYGQPYTDLSANAQYNCSASGWVKAAGGGSPPASPAFAVQFAGTGATAFNADGSFMFNPTSHGLSTLLANGSYNTDTAETGGGNNGLANLMSSVCASGACTPMFPATSTSTENAYATFTTVANTHVQDYRNGSQGDFYYDPIVNGAGGFNPTGQPFSGGHQIFGTWDALTQAPDFSQKQTAHSLYLTFNGPGWDYGSPYPGFSGPAWSLQSGISMTMNDSTPGIGQMLGGQFSKYSIGDSQNFYFYNHCDGGAIASADEGCTGGGIQRLQNATWFHGTPVSGSSHGTLLLKTTFSTGRTQYAIGGTMLDTTHLVGVGTVTGTAAQFSGLAAWSTPVTGVTFTESTAWAQAQAAIPPLANPGNQTPQSDTVNFTVLGGTNAGGFTTGQACLDGEEMYESVQITAVGTLSGGTQSVTFNHFFPNGQVGTSLWQGGPCGDYYLPQRDYLNGWAAPYIVLGAPDTTHLVGRFFQTGGNGNPTNNSKPIPNYYSAVTANVPLLNLTISGTTVTATYGANNPLQYNGLSSAVVSSCTNSAFNGTTGNITAIGSQQLQWTQSGPSGTSSSCLLSFPSLTFNFYLIPGAELKGPCTSAGCTLEPNTVAWNAGDTVENPPNPAFRGYTFTLNDQINTQIPLVGTGGISVSTEGDGASGNYALFSWQNNNLMNHYIGDGGRLSAPKFLNVAGVTGTLITDQFAPIDGSPLFNIGCPISAQGGCNSNLPINIFQINTGIMSYTYPTQTFNFTNLYGISSIHSPILSTGTEAHGGTPVAMTSANSELNNVPMGAYAVFGSGGLFDNSAAISSKENDTALIYAGAKVPGGNGVFVGGTPGSSTYSYQATSVTQLGEGLPTASITTNTGNATLSATNFNALNITPGYGAQFINVYRTAAPGGYTVPSLICANITIALANNGGCKDTGQAGTAVGPPTADTTGDFQNSGHSIIVRPWSLTTTAAASDTVTVSGMTSSGHCSFGATNAAAATNIATTYISAKTTNQITVTHTATASMTYDGMCTVY
jgi:hypothetical protein